MRGSAGLSSAAVAGVFYCIFFLQAEDGIRDLTVTGVQTCALPISSTKAFEGFRSARPRASWYAKTNPNQIRSWRAKSAYPRGRTRRPAATAVDMNPEF